MPSMAIVTRHMTEIRNSDFMETLSVGDRSIIEDQQIHVVRAIALCPPVVNDCMLFGRNLLDGAVMIRLLVVDDHPPSREQAIKDLAQGDLIEIIAEAETSDEAFKLSKSLLPDVVLLDLHLPGLIQTPDLLRKLVGLPNVKVVIFASQSKASEVQDYLDGGAAAYVLKSDPPALLRMSILMVQKGNRGIVSPALPRNLLRLSAQERGILKEITRRGGIAKAAERMGLTEFDLNQLLLHLVDKLELESIEELAKWAKKNGF